MRRSLRSALLAGILAVAGRAPAAAAPDNDRTLHFELTCDDGNVYQASFNGGPVRLPSRHRRALHLEGDLVRHADR